MFETDNARGRGGSKINAFRTGEGKNLKVAYDDKVSWPFEWYFRDWTGKNFYGIDPDNTARRANARADGTVLKSIN